MKMPFLCRKQQACARRGGHWPSACWARLYFADEQCSPLRQQHRFTIHLISLLRRQLPLKGKPLASKTGLRNMRKQNPYRVKIFMKNIPPGGLKCCVYIAIMEPS